MESRTIEKEIHLATSIALLANPAWHEGQFETELGGPIKVKKIQRSETENKRILRIAVM